MIVFFRNKKSSKIKFLLFLILILSFAVWGIGTINLNNQQESIIQVNGINIPNNLFFALYKKNQIENNMPGIVQKSYLVNLTLIELIQQALLAHYAKKIGLQVTKKQIIDYISTIPAFFDSNGHFDQERMNRILEQNNLTQTSFINTIKTQILLNELYPIIHYQFPIPNEIAKHLFHINYAKRVLWYTYIPRKKAIFKTPIPTLKQKKIYYEQHKKLFIVPEERIVNILTIPVSKIRPNISITQQELKMAYQAHKGLFVIPEKRSLFVMSFPTQQKANLAYKTLKIKQIRTKNTFIKVGISNGLSKDSMNLGVLSKSNIPDPIIRKEAFALHKNEFSKPIHGTFGWTILYLKDIFPSHIQPFHQVVNKIKVQLQKEKNNEFLDKMIAQITNNLSKGQTIIHLAKQFSLPLQEVSLHKGQSSVELKKFGILNLQDRIFQSSLEEVSPPIKTKSGYLYFLVKHITPEIQKPFSQAIEQVTQLAREQLIHDQERIMAQKYAQSITKNKAIFQFKNIHKIILTPFTLDTNDIPLPKDFLKKAFISSQDIGFSSIQDKFIYLGIVTHIDPPSEKAISQYFSPFLQFLNRKRANITETQFLTALFHKNNVHINQIALQKAMKSMS